MSFLVHHFPIVYSKESKEEGEGSSNVPLIRAVKP